MNEDVELGVLLIGAVSHMSAGDRCDGCRSDGWIEVDTVGAGRA